MTWVKSKSLLRFDWSVAPEATLKEAAFEREPTVPPAPIDSVPELTVTGPVKLFSAESVVLPVEVRAPVPASLADTLAPSSVKLVPSSVPLRTVASVTAIAATS